MAANITDGGVLNYSRPILGSSSSTVMIAGVVPPRPVRSPGRARTDDEGRGFKKVSITERFRFSHLAYNLRFAFLYL